MKLHVFICIFIVFCLGLSVKAETYTHECTVWEDISAQLERERNVDVKCQRNAECSGLDCDGKYAYKLNNLTDLYGLLHSTTLDFCMGMVLEACTQPTVLQMYVVLFHGANRSSNTEKTIRDGNTTFALNGGNFEFLGNNATAEVETSMNHQTINNRPYISLSMEMKMKVKTIFGFFKIDQEIQGMEVTLIPDMLIPVPKCNPSIANHTHIPKTCSWDVITKLPNYTSPDLGACVPNSMRVCGRNQFCHGKRCYCLPEHVYQNTTGSCVALKTLEFDPDNLPSSDTSTGSNSWVVIVCSIIGALVLVSIVAAVVVKVKRYRAQYSQHQLVLSEDPEDDPEV